LDIQKPKSLYNIHRYYVNIAFSNSLTFIFYKTQVQYRLF